MLLVAGVVIIIGGVRGTWKRVIDALVYSPSMFDWRENTPAPGGGGGGGSRGFSGVQPGEPGSYERTS